MLRSQKPVTCHKRFCDARPRRKNHGVQPTLLIHILAGSLGLVSGFVALYTTKGAPVHRRAGLIFVWVMLTMTFTGTIIAAVRGAAPALNIPAAVITAYLVVTGLITVRPTVPGARRLTVAAMLVAFAVGLIALSFAFQTAAGARQGMPAFPFFMFGLIGLFGGIGDLRMIRSSGLQGAPRLARHLWRMSAALLIAAMSFFFGQADELPKALRNPGLLALPVLAVFVTMLFWVWRIRIQRTLRGVVGASVSQTWTYPPKGETG